MDILPSDSNRRTWRACLLCGLIKTKDQFRRKGCDNCEEILSLKGSQTKVSACTSAQFDGVIGMMNPEVSWVGRWQRVDKFVKGLYAIRVTGRLPEEVVEDMADRGLSYRPRDGSSKD
ncbi:transcription elongation factor spt4 [Chytridiales sp. JEL 0842]|nr:transcription elongation factor spt4 [Chytridiales sp. JEL 0842]